MNRIARSTVGLMMFSMMLFGSFSAAQDSGDESPWEIAIPKPTPEETAAIETLIKDLGSSDGDTGERAAKELTKIGRPATRLLREALSDPNPEISRRAAGCLESIPQEILFFFCEGVQTIWVNGAIKPFVVRGVPSFILYKDRTAIKNGLKGRLTKKDFDGLLKSIEDTGATKFTQKEIAQNRWIDANNRDQTVTVGMSLKEGRRVLRLTVPDVATDCRPLLSGMRTRKWLTLKMTEEKPIVPAAIDLFMSACPAEPRCGEGVVPWPLSIPPATLYEKCRNGRARITDKSIIEELHGIPNLPGEVSIVGGTIYDYHSLPVFPDVDEWLK